MFIGKESIGISPQHKAKHMLSPRVPAMFDGAAMPKDTVTRLQRLTDPNPSATQILEDLLTQMRSGEKQVLGPVLYSFAAQQQTGVRFELPTFQADSRYPNFGPPVQTIFNELLATEKKTRKLSSEPSDIVGPTGSVNGPIAIMLHDPPIEVKSSSTWCPSENQAMFALAGKLGLENGPSRQRLSFESLGLLLFDLVPTKKTVHNEIDKGPRSHPTSPFGLRKSDVASLKCKDWGRDGSTPMKAFKTMHAGLLRQAAEIGQGQEGGEKIGNCFILFQYASQHDMTHERIGEVVFCTPHYSAFTRRNASKSSVAEPVLYHENKKNTVMV